MRKSRVIEAYRDPDHAAIYDKRPGTHRSEIRVLSRLIGDLPPRRTVLDAPCGNGRLAPFLRALDPRRLLGLDGSPEMAAEAASGYDAILAGDCSSLPLETGAADLVVSVRLLHHFPEPADRIAILRELARVARSAVVFSYYSSSTLQGLRRRLRGRSARVAIPASAILGEAREAGLGPFRTASLLPLVREQTFVRASVRS